MNRYARQFPIAALCVLLFVGCDRKASDEIDFGAVTQSVYQNDYFGMRVPLPPDWSVQDAKMRQKLAEVGTKMVAGEDKKMKAVMKASELQSVNLLAAFKHPVGAPVPFNPSIASVAERVRDLPGIARGKDYHFHARKLMEASQAKFEFPKEMTTETLGGVEFDVMHVVLSVGAAKVKQKYYATIMKGYALIVVVSFTNAEEESTLQKILAGVTFKS